MTFILWGNGLHQYIISLAIILLFIGIGQIFSLLVVKFLKKLAAKTDTLLDDILINILEKPLIFTLFIIGFTIIEQQLTLTPRGIQVWSRIITILIIIDIIWILIRLTDAIIEHYLHPLVKKSESDLDDQLLPFAKTFVKVIIVIIGILFLIHNFGYDITSLIAGLGIGGLAFALAAQPLLTNLFGGIAIIADKPFAIGDRVRIDDKFEGYIIQIGMRSTTVKTGKGTILHVPNAVIASSVVENISTTKDHAIRATFDLGLVYNTSNAKIEEAVVIVKEILEKNPDVIKNDPNSSYYVGFNMFKDSSLNVTVGYSHPPEKTSLIRTQINLEIKKRFEDAGIEFAYPTQTVYVKN
ncbi:MAG: mechanosensitive ion channel family protein [Candidatus Woesearchaeota archaeon]